MIRKKTTCFVEDPSAVRIHNHFECNYFLGNKKALFYYLDRYYDAKKVDPFTRIPLTFHISKGVDDPAYHTKFMDEFNRL